MLFLSSVAITWFRCAKKPHSDKAVSQALASNNLRHTWHARLGNPYVVGKSVKYILSPLLGEPITVLKSTPLLRRSLTWDRGLEMAQHKSFTVATNVKVYFCDPQSPWQRGSNENTNGLLRQYFPKRTDLSGYSQSELDKIALRLNQRPRKTLGFQTPASTLRANVATTH